MKNFIRNRTALGGGKLTAEALIESGTALNGTPGRYWRASALQPDPVLTFSDLQADIAARWFADSPLAASGFAPVWGFSCQGIVLVFADSLFGAGKAVLRPVACDQVRGARGRGQGTETRGR